MSALEIQPLAAAPNIRAMLSEILIEVVAHGNGGLMKRADVASRR